MTLWLGFKWIPRDPDELYGPWDPFGCTTLPPHTFFDYFLAISQKSEKRSRPQSPLCGLPWWPVAVLPCLRSHDGFVLILPTSALPAARGQAELECGLRLTGHPWGPWNMRSRFMNGHISNGCRWPHLFLHSQACLWVLAI